MIALDKLLSIFQSTPPRRRRQFLPGQGGGDHRFQSTPPRRRRRIPGREVQQERIYFNPRLREGGDLTFYSSYMGMIISIHASAKEATEIRARGPHSKKDFNPRLLRGGDMKWTNYAELRR